MAQRRKKLYNFNVLGS